MRESHVHMLLALIFHSLGVVNEKTPALLGDHKPVTAIEATGCLNIKSIFWKLYSSELHGPICLNYFSVVFILLNHTCFIMNVLFGDLCFPFFSVIVISNRFCHVHVSILNFQIFKFSMFHYSRIISFSFWNMWFGHLMFVRMF